MLIDDQSSHDFLTQAKKIVPSVVGINDRKTQYFNRDGEIINRIRPELQDQGYCGIRMAFFLGDPIAPDGNLFPNQHI
jgi:indole-3-glycerol phosphate synthase